MTTIALDPQSTPAGLMERLFLHETMSPAYAAYDRDDSLKAMRLMRQVLENRLLNARYWGAPGATSVIDIITIRSQFGAFGDYPDIPARFMSPVYAMVHLANTPSDQRSAANAQHVQDAITAATEANPPADVKIANLVAWRTAGHSSPGARFVAAVTIQGNTFYTAEPIPHPAPHAHH